MTAELIDQASALEEMMRAGKRIRDARCALSVRVRWNYGISRGDYNVENLN